MARRVVLFAALFFIALTSGGAFVVYLIFNPAHMSPAFYVETMQHGIRVLIPLAVVLNLGLLFTIVSGVLARRDLPSFYLLIAANLCIIVSVSITVFGNWPINNHIITWGVNSLPSNWTELRDEWWRFHVARAVMTIATLSLLILAALLPRDVSK